MAKSGTSMEAMLCGVCVFVMPKWDETGNLFCGAWIIGRCHSTSYRQRRCHGGGDGADIQSNGAQEEGVWEGGSSCLILYSKTAWVAASDWLGLT